MNTKYGYIYMWVLMSVTIVTCDNNGKCNYREIKTQSETSCRECNLIEFEKCPQNTKQITDLYGIRGCKITRFFNSIKHYGCPDLCHETQGSFHGYRRSQWEYLCHGCFFRRAFTPRPDKGCSHLCEKTQQVYDCCHGYWGPQCDECPGGHKTPCNGHGQCNETIEGTGLCQCDAGWSGYACEFCIDPDIGGDQCTTDSIDSVADICKNFTCPNNSECVSIDNEAICSCKWPYIEHDETVANSTTDIVCKEIDRCKLPPYCDGNATCEESTQTDSIDKTCTCNHGYTGDGYICVPIDPCQSNNGGCNVTTSTCLYLEPGKSKCECKDGYEFSNTSTETCELIDICITQNITCDVRATCVTLSVDKTVCQCPDGYEGDGQNCYGNIVQTIEDLNEHDPVLKGQFTLILKAIQKYYYSELTEHASFTMFVPVDDGFRAVDNPDFQAWLNDEVRVRQIIRQHVIVGEFKADNLTDANFATLQGTVAVLNTNWRNEFRFRLLGDNRKGKILKKDIVAVNGMIHVINKLMVNEPNILINRQNTIYDSLNSRYRDMKNWITTLGTDIKDILMNDNVTFFAPFNLNSEYIPVEAKTYLMSQQGREQRKILILNHIFPGWIEITDLINTDTITSLANITNEISVLPNGKIKLNGQVTITQADMTASNGYIHDLDGLLITSTMSVYPNRCENDTSGQGPGCCSGFYGPDCLVCPGGYTYPCRGHGTCDDGISGNGTCTCYPQFTGLLCGSCIANRWGPNCSQECNCLHGTCDWYSGTCTCHPGYLGDNCDRNSWPCAHDAMFYRLYFIHCHVNALCVSVDDHTYRCMCKTGYEGDGERCQEIDPCLTNRGGCHLQATCKKTGPGMSECTCNHGFQGDGHYCYGASECHGDNHCHEHATCVENNKGKRVCQCMDGYHGNGSSCWHEDKCKINNGGCHSHAKCSHTDRFNATVACTCYTDLGYKGNGYDCKLSLLDLIKEKFEGSPTADIIAKVEEATGHLDLWDNGDYTVFVWSDNAVRQLQSGMIGLPKNLFTILKAHTIQGKHSLDYLSSISSVIRLKTLLHGFSFYVTKGENDEYYVMLQRAGKVTLVLSHDMEAYNGYINVIDSVLLPIVNTDGRDDIFQDWRNLTDSHNVSWTVTDPSLTDFMVDYPDYSIFMDALKDKNLTSMLENDSYPFTLFIPSNKHMQNINRTVTKDFLRYYIVPYTEMLWTVSTGKTLQTDLGIDHQLQLDWIAGTKITINGVPVIKHDLFVNGGMVNFIDGLLHPVLNWCKVNFTQVEMGPCNVCAEKMYSCLEGRTPVPNGNVIHCKYTEKTSLYLDEVLKSGCQGPCVKTLYRKECCAGHYGDTCQECPGGPEIPCDGHGQCDTGMAGNGSCICDTNFDGPYCNNCTSGFVGPNCDIDLFGCGFFNGGCHQHATCNYSNKDNITCQCMEGFTGDGYNCTGPCDINNGGCPSNAECKYTFQSGVKCSCKVGYVGDGDKYCMGNIYTSLSLVPDISWFYKSIMSIDDKSLIKKLNSTDVTYEFTLFVPTDENLFSMISKYSVLQQTVLSSERLVLHPVDFTNVSITTLSNQSIFVSYDPSEHIFYANNTKIISGNIKFTNGIVHIVQHPFTPPTKLTEMSSFPAGSVVGVVISIIVVVGLIIVAVVIVYRQSRSGFYWTSLNKWLANKEMSSDVDNHPLHNEIDDTSSHYTGLPHSNNFDNPLFVTATESIVLNKDHE